MNQQSYTTAQLVAMFRIKPELVRQWAKRGKLKRVKRDTFLIIHPQAKKPGRPKKIKETK